MLKYYRDDFRRARVKAYARVGRSIYERAIAGESWAATLTPKLRWDGLEKNKLEVENCNNNTNISLTMTPKEALDAYMQVMQDATRGPPRFEDE